jgi:3-carboxy-cis,cis-muconate cycloisomerase
LPFSELFFTDAIREPVGEAAWIAALLEVESALARAAASAGVIPAEAAAAIADACAQANPDPRELAVDGRRVGNVVEPLVRQLRDAVGGDAATFVHYGATSQDILDSATAIVCRDAREVIANELRSVATECARLADEHRATVIAGRTLLQQATPTTFGLKAATWLVGVVEARDRLVAVRLPAQLGGAAGTLAALGDRGIDVLAAFARELRLDEPAVPWHVTRTPVRELAAALDLAAAACAKIATDVILLAQTEVAEVREPREGGSSTMPHKRNPVGSTLARACALQAHAAASVLTALPHEHERAAGAWHAEWNALYHALLYTGGAAEWMHETLAGLEVDADRMRANLTPETLSEAERFGGAREPDDYLGSANAFIDRALALGSDPLEGG